MKPFSVNIINLEIELKIYKQLIGKDKLLVFKKKIYFFIKITNI